MNYEGEKFLLKLYKKLYNEESVKHSSTKSDNKYEAVKKYIERLERVHEKAINHKNDNGVKLLKSFYYDKYVIKKEDIPESYINYLDKVQFDQYGIHMNEYQKEEQKDLIIENQKKSLDEWLDYFTSEDAKFYPTWAKYWAFQGMLTIGNYDTNKGIYNKRSKTTVAPFPELDREVLSKSIDLVIREINKEEIEDKVLEQLVKNGNFFKLYTVQLKDKRKNSLSEETKGEWIKYEQGDNYQELHKSLQGKNTGWCTAGEETCKLQVKGGDFYVYYTYDKKGKATIPRLAIRMDGKTKIGEIRGVAKDQNIEPHFEDILAKKLENFPDAEHYRKRVKDTQMLTYVYTKYKNNKQLTEKDIKFIYEIDDKIYTMGWQIDPRLQEMKYNKLRRTTPNLKDKELILFFNKIRSIALSYLAEGVITDKALAIDLVSEGIGFLKCVSREIMDKDIALAAVKKNALVLKDIPKDLIDKEIALAALQENGRTLEYIPKEVIDKEVALTAAPLHSASMKFIPKETIDKDVLFLAVKQFSIAIKYAPKELLDKDIIMAALQVDGGSLEYIPKSLIDKEMILAAVKNKGIAIEYAPKELIDHDIIMVALQVDGRSLEYIPKNLIDKEMILAAVKNKGIAIGSAPKELIDHDIIMAALQVDGYALGYIPKELIDREMILTAVKSPGFAIQYVPKSLIDQEISQAAIENDELAIIYIPEEIKKELQKKKKKKKTKDKLEQTNKETKWKLCLKKKRKR